MKCELISAKAAKIKALFLDVDGVLTDGSFYLGSDGQEIKRFHTHDGFGIKALQKSGVTIAIISGRKSSSVEHRMHELGIQEVYQGIGSKITIYKQLLKSLKLNDSQVAYMGDDLPDLDLIKQAGFSIAPANAVYTIKQNADWVTEKNGGQGAVREVCDFILRIQKKCGLKG